MENFFTVKAGDRVYCELPDTNIRKWYPNLHCATGRVDMVTRDSVHVILDHDGGLAIMEKQWVTKIPKHWFPQD